MVIRAGSLLPERPIHWVRNLSRDDSTACGLGLADVRWHSQESDEAPVSCSECRALMRAAVTYKPEQPGAVGPAVDEPPVPNAALQLELDAARSCLPSAHPHYPLDLRLSLIGTREALEEIHRLLSSRDATHADLTRALRSAMDRCPRVSGIFSDAAQAVEGVWDALGAMKWILSAPTATSEARPARQLTPIPTVPPLVTPEAQRRSALHEGLALLDRARAQFALAARVTGSCRDWDSEHGAELHDDVRGLSLDAETLYRRALSVRMGEIADRTEGPAKAAVLAAGWRWLGRIGHGRRQGYGIALHDAQGVLVASGYTRMPEDAASLMRHLSQQIARGGHHVG
ncbi:hypothetical protein FJV41_04120 [Myxococcus llanfairpwllgwyngyllgogerychwyrndrobwllllantysiliogogogochensis]|uniref:Uncharacterized protein n=2 Tax=Myxococcus TaxID=32 RepID=A0A540X7E8_9BACT|nr:hypothetical protein [Myxococcus llanfairpwllgwyngyllgogerychwyrndrobwllllantysiliogogogochensis]TQF17236.1 hypothetical protein FJV41_04120 [Myxococcus llanfairpwllgwyngyllgogerychwyrndrobwllllantysiliogogogochensis]